MDKPFYYSEQRLVSHLTEEAAAKQLAYQLQNRCNALRYAADSDSAYRCREIAETAEDLYKYCLKMCDALDEMQLEMRYLNSSVRESVDDTNIRAHKLLAGLDELEEIAARY